MCDRCCEIIEYRFQDSVLHRTGASLQSYVLFLCGAHIQQFASVEEIAEANALRAKGQRKAQAAEKRWQKLRKAQLIQEAKDKYLASGWKVDYVLCVDSRERWYLFTKKWANENKAELIAQKIRAKFVTTTIDYNGNKTAWLDTWLFQ